ncbi:MAG: tetratricopeptide repeat protein [Bryobacteraceae bacterium]|jgi:tetratricopeptide (TPR) repeat protein
MLRGTAVFFPVLILGAVLTPLFGQRGGSSSGGSTVIPGNPLTQNGPYLSGHVTLEDGSVPTEKVIIQSICAGKIREETTMDKKGGGFGFTLGKGSGDLMLNEDNRLNQAGPATTENLQSCSVQAYSPGYMSSVVFLGNLDQGKPDVGTLILRKAAAGAAGGSSDTAKQASKDAHKAFDKGAEAAKSNKWSDAATNFRKAAELSPGYADAWLELGKAQMALKQTDEARKSLEASIKADEKYAAPYVQLMQLENQAQNWKGLTDAADRLLKLTPAVPPLIYYLDSAAQYRLKNYEAAESISRDGIKADTGHEAPKLHQVLASCMILRNDAAGAEAEIKQYLAVAPLAADAEKMKAMLAELEARAQAAPAKQ